jgi:hypothetical protein
MQHAACLPFKTPQQIFQDPKAELLGSPRVQPQSQLPPLATTQYMGLWPATRIQGICPRLALAACTSVDSRALPCTAFSAALSRAAA